MSNSDRRTNLRAISFVVHASTSCLYKNWVYALFELCCRAGLRVSFEKPGALKSNSVVRVHWLADWGGSPQCIGKDEYVIQVSSSSLELRETKFGQILAGQLDSMGDVVRGAIALLSFSCERDSGFFDTYGRVPQSKTLLADVVRVPLLDNAAEVLGENLQARYPELHRLGRPWGNGKVVVAITHDVDGPMMQSTFAALRSAILSLRGSVYERESLEAGLATWWFGRPDPYWTFDDWTRLNRSAFGAKSTYYFFSGGSRGARQHRNDPHYRLGGERFKAQMHRLIEAGCEIGVHFGINARTQEDFALAADCVKQVCGVPMAGGRTHYWSGVWDAPYVTWENMRRCGLRYDASLNPLEMGFRAGLANPITPSFSTTGSLDDAFIVLPTAVMDGHAHPRYVSKSAARLEADLNEVIENVLRTGFLAIDWHERAFSNIGAWKGFMGPYFRLLSALTSRADVEFVVAHDAANRWLKHVHECVLPMGDEI
jgi:hypothetical protein